MPKDDPESWRNVESGTSGGEGAGAGHTCGARGFRDSSSLAGGGGPQLSYLLGLPCGRVVRKTAGKSCYLQTTKEKVAEAPGMARGCTWAEGHLGHASRAPPPTFCHCPLPPPILPGSPYRAVFGEDSPLGPWQEFSIALGIPVRSEAQLAWLASAGSRTHPAARAGGGILVIQQGGPQHSVSPG